MDIRNTKSGKTVIAHLSGQFTYSDDKKFMDTARELVLDQPLTLAIDVSGLPHVNSTLIAAFLAILKMANEQGCEFVIYGMNPGVMSVLEKVFSSDLVPLLTEEEFMRKYL
ncbi:MAG TPA: STAS domain-containing protein [Spirochaetota bacterium]|nr:STAS domain-containing protein [Spirochaetota bacterium]